MRPRTRRLALTLAVSIWTVLPAVPTGVARAAACDDATAPKRTTRTTAASAIQSPANPSLCATRCDRKPEPMRIAGHGTRTASVACPSSDPQQDPISSDRAWSLHPGADVQVNKASMLPVAPLWFATVTDPSVLQWPLRAMGEWARRKTPATSPHAPLPNSRTQPVWVGELL